MATEGLNKIFCGADVANVGVCECFFDPKLIIGAIAVPKGKVFTNAELLDANIVATMNAAISAAKVSRIFPFQGFVAITDNTEDPTQQTFGYGGIQTVREGNYNWLFQITAGGLNASNARRTFNGLTGKFAFLFFDSQNTLFGTSKLDANGNYGMAGVPMEDIYTQPWRASDGTNVTNYSTRFTFRPPFINENISFKKVATTTLMLTELNGLEDIELTIVEADEVEDTVLITAATDCGSTDLYDLYADELNQAGAWVVKDASGAAITVTVSKDDAAKGWLLTYTTADVTDGDTITLAAPAVLQEPPISVVGYESNTVTVELGS